MVPQRVPAAPGPAGLHRATDLLLKVLGGIILLMLLYSVFARVARRDSPPSTGFVKDDVFLDVVARLRGKEHELERLRSAAEERAREIESYNENILRSVSSGVITFNRESVVTTFNDAAGRILRSEEHTSELQSQFHLVCRLLLEKKKKQQTKQYR